MKDRIFIDEYGNSYPESEARRLGLIADHTYGTIHVSADEMNRREQHAKMMRQTYHVLGLIKGATNGNKMVEEN